MHVLVCIAVCIASANSNASSEIGVLLLLPKDDRSEALNSAARLAVEQINNSTEVLTANPVTLVAVESECAETGAGSEAAMSFVRQVFMHSRKTRILGVVVGPVCHESTRMVATLGSHTNVSLVNFQVSVSPLVNRYPNTFGMFVAPNQYMETILTLMLLNNWRQAVVFYEETDPFFVRDYLVNNGSLLLLPVSATYIPVDRLNRESDLRIAFVFARTEISNQLLCLAYHNGVVFPDYQFIFVNKTQSDFVGVNFIYNGQPYSCSNETNLDGHLLLTPKVVCQDSITREEMVPSGSDVGHYPISGVYDGISSLALSLNNSIEILQNQNLTLLDYQYRRSHITDIVRNQIFQLDFQSASGRIRFDPATGYVSRTIEIHQLVDGERNLAYNSAGELFNASNEIVFIQDQFECVQVSVPSAVAVVFILLTSIVALPIVIAHILTCVNRNKRQIEASSPELSHCIFLGCYALIFSGYIFIVVFVFPPASNSLAGSATCNLFIWLGSLSYSLVFGTLCAKTWRLYRIFASASHFRKAGKQLKDYGLVTFIVTLVTLNLIVLIIFTAQATPVLLLFPLTETLEEQKTFFQLACTSGSVAINSLWYVVLIGYQALLAFVMTVVALLHHFEKANTLIMLDYFATIDYCLGIPAIILSSFFSSTVILFSLWFIVGTVLLCLCFFYVFLPPFYKLYRLPKNVQH